MSHTFTYPESVLLLPYSYTDAASDYPELFTSYRIWYYEQTENKSVLQLRLIIKDEVVIQQCDSSRHGMSEVCKHSKVEGELDNNNDN